MEYEVDAASSRCFTKKINEKKFLFWCNTLEPVVYVGDAAPL